MLHLIVGNTGAGKTTYALDLKDKNNAILFSLDEWNYKLFLMDMPPTEGLDWILQRIERCEQIMMGLIEQLESSGVDSILDLGFAKFEQRERFRQFAISNGFQYMTHFLNIKSETRRQRVIERNIKKGETFQFKVSQSDFEFMEDWFEEPSDEELTSAIVKQ